MKYLASILGIYLIFLRITPNLAEIDQQGAISVFHPSFSQQAKSSSSSENIINLEISALERLGLLHVLKSSPYSNSTLAKSLAIDTLQNLTEKVFALGLEGLKDKLEDVSFAILHPKARHIIIKYSSKFVIPGTTRAESLKLIGERLAKTLIDNGIKNPIIEGRYKTPFSIWNKMKLKNYTLEDIKDYLGFHVIVKTIEDCYKSAWIFYLNYQFVPGRFKDYIRHPKPSGYEAIHIGIIGPFDILMELQIKTKYLDILQKESEFSYWKNKTRFI